MTTTSPPGGLRSCASCGRLRGNQRAEWTAVVKNDVIVGFTCSMCPTASEPIRREETQPGRVVFRARVDSARYEPGRPRKQVAKTFDTLADARQFVAEVRAAVAAGGTARTAVETVAQLCTRWIESRIDVRPTTRETYAHWLAPLDRHPFAKVRVAEVTLRDLQAFIEFLRTQGGRPKAGEARGTPLLPNSVRSVRAGLQLAFDMALLEGTVTVNLIRLAKWPQGRQKRGHDLEHWQPAELMKFRDVADSDPLGGVWRLTLCGMTRADLMGLRWSDIDMSEGVASVSQGRVEAAHGETVTDVPKSDQRVRAVPFEAIHPGTLVLLRTIHAKQAKDQLRAGEAWVNSGLVLVNAMGAGIGPQAYSDRFKRLCALASVPVIHLHSVRHSIAFWLHQIGVAPADAAALLGHTTEVHLSTYLPHSGAAGIRAAARALGQAAREHEATAG